MRKISSFALFAFLMPLAGCPAGDDGETDTVVGTTTMTPPATGTETAGETAVETAGETAVETAADTTAGGGGSGFCALACMTPADCGTPETDWACNEGFCEYIGMPPACDDTTCPAAAGLACADVNGVNICTIPCTEGGTECDLVMQECTGMDDAGNMICQAPPPPPCGGAAEGEPCTFGGADRYGVCMGGECVCADDTECTAMGFACQN